MINKIKNNIVLNGGIVNLDESSQFSHIVINNDTILNDFSLNRTVDLKIKINDNSNLTINIFKITDYFDGKLDLEISDNAKININIAFINKNKFNFDIDTKLYGNNIDSSVNVRGINGENGSVRIEMNGTVAGETNSNVLNEYAKILNRGNNQNVLIPNLIVNTNEITANHGVSIGTIDPCDIFYLKCKGLDDIQATKLIEDGFILAIFENREKESIKNIIIGR